jgi:hypothetical protein
MDGPLGLAETTWLDEHLAGCADCTAVAAAYEAERRALRGLRDATIEPPRDLWARTAAGIESAAAGAGTRSSRGGWAGRRGPLGALSGIAAVVVVVGFGSMSSGWFGGTGTGPVTAAASPTTDPPEAAGTPAVTASPTTAPTPLAVGAGDVHWIGSDADGSLAYSGTEVREVCPLAQAEDCALLDPSPGEHVSLAVAPKSIIGSPTQHEAVVVTDDGAGGDRITVLTLPVAAASPTPEPSVDPTASAQPTPTDALASPTPVATVQPSPSATAETSPSPSVTPEPTVAAEFAIATGVTVVGESAAYSADGSWFAFTARSVDGQAGPDVYVWRVGETTARQLTSDGLSSFASWDDDEVVASRPGPVTAGGTAEPASVLIDPATGSERPAGAVWRPVVDPTGSRAVTWVGTVTTQADPVDVRPAAGRLELLGWTAGEGIAEGGSQVVGEATETTFDVRWDESGTWFATWVADPSGSDVGRLSLYRVNPGTGLVEVLDGAPVEVPALAGFSIGSGRLAWATPPGQDGEGSRVQIVAWADDGVGAVETAPGDRLVVVR